MSFIVESLKTEENLERILHDAKQDEKKLKVLTDFPYRLSRIKYLVIDRDRDYYFYNAPILVPMVRAATIYYMFFNKNLYEIEEESLRSGIFKLNDNLGNTEVSP